MRCAVRAARALESGRPLPVHSVYRRTGNLSGPEGLLALHPQEIPLTPVSAALPLSESAFGYFAAHAKEAKTVAFLGGVLFGGQVSLFVGPLDVWQPRLSVRLSGAKRRRLRKDVEAFLSALCVKEGPQGLADAAVDPAPRPGSGAVEAALRSVFAAVLFAAPDFSACAKAAKGLVGLGGGLTPSGDDALVGMLCAFWAAGAEKALFAFAGAVRSAAARTNDISRAFLQCAAGGEFGEVLHGLLHAADIESPLEEPLQAVRAFGHTSGIDTLNGLALGLRLLEQAEREGK